MYLSVIVLPLVSTLLTGIIGRLIGNFGAMILTNIFIFVTYLVAIISFYEVNLTGVKVAIELGEWFSFGTLEVKWGFLFDSVTCVLLVVITSISSLVHLYSTCYMETDPHLIRFLTYLSLFTLFMIILVTSDNFVQVFLGWEGVGVSSYLLINFWFTRTSANQSAIKAILINKVGDVGLLLGILFVGMLVNSLDFAVIFSQLHYLESEYFFIGNYEIHALSLISIFFFIGAIGKSAQMGLHTWLPDAMEGPTPVSALIHAATMVTAGVFILARISPLLEYTPIVLNFIAGIGVLTGFFAGTLGIFQNDLKRVIAYSTCSQLGYMVAACGLSGYSQALFHLMNHAFFKALLFLSAGAVIHAIIDEQDMRKMGGLLNVLPYTYSVFLIGSLALAGFPFTAGFYSKDIIIEVGMAKYQISTLLIFWLLNISACCTGFYSLRVLYLTFLDEIKMNKKIFKQVNDVSFRMGLPLFLLTLGSIFIGYICKDMFLGIGSPFFGNSLGITKELSRYITIEPEFLEGSIKIIPLICSLFGGSLVYIYYRTRILETTFNSLILSQQYFVKKWYFDQLFNKIFSDVGLTFGYLISFKLLDRGLIELYGPTGLIRGVEGQKKMFLQHNSGYLFKAVLVITSSVMLYAFIIRNVGLIKEYTIICILLYVFFYLVKKKK